MENIYFVWQKKPVEIEENLQLPQFKLQTHFLYDCVQNYTAGECAFIIIFISFHRFLFYWLKFIEECAPF